MRVLIVGSCVTRDSFERPFGSELEIAEYFARSSLVSATSPEPFTEFDGSTIESAFQRRVVDFDHSRALLPFIRSGNYESVIYDPIDERFDLVEINGRVATRSNEFLRGKLGPGTEVRVKAFTDEFYARWEEAWSTFIKELESVDRARQLRIHVARWATCGQSGPLPDHELGAALRANTFLGRLYKRMAADVEDSQFIVPKPEFAVAADEHKWGRSLFHYPPDYYADFVDKFNRSFLDRAREGDQE